MSAAWMMLYSRRYRSRKSEPDLEPDPGSPSRGSDRCRSRHHSGGGGHHSGGSGHHSRGSGHHRSEDWDPHPRSHSLRALRSDPEPVQLECTNIKSRAAIGNRGGVVSREDIRTGIITTHPFDGPVEEARARLVERLGGFSLTGNREAPVDTNVVWDRVALNDGFTMPPNRGRQPGIQGSIEPGLSNEEFSAHLSESLASRDVSREKTPRINLEHQQRDVFRNSEVGAGSTRGPPECCICLDKFKDSDELIVLNCAHRFHLACLEPWVQTSNNCPYCRAGIMC